MGDIFDKIQENAKAEFMFARANIVLEFEETLTKDQRSNPDWFPTYLQVLVPTLSEEENGEGDAWQGKMRALRKTMTDVKQKLGSDIETLTTKLVESEAKREKAEKRLEEATEDLGNRLREATEKAEKRELETNLMLKSILESVTKTETEDKDRDKEKDDEKDDI